MLTLVTCKIKERRKMKKIILGSVSLLAVLVAAPQTFAKDMPHKKYHHHGYHHSEVDALRAQVQELLARIDNIETKEKADTESVVTSGAKDVSVEISGQVNRAIQQVGDGNRRRVRHVENSADSTQFRMEAKAKMNNDLSAGAKIEVGVNTNRTDSINIQTGADGTQVDPRKAEIMFISKAYGGYYNS